MKDKTFFLDQSVQHLFNQFMETKKSIYVYNILLRYFYLYFLHEKLIKKLNITLHMKYSINDLLHWYENSISYNYIEDSLKIINSPKWIPLCGVDHTFYYSIDIESNIELFRHFAEYPWDEWNNGVVLEVGSGFGIYSFVFNLFKKYYNLDNLHIYSFDFDTYKVDKLKDLYKFLKLTDNNDFIIGDCSKKETFEFLRKEKIYLLYSETFSGKGAHTQDYFKIMNNVFNNFNETLSYNTHIFPYEFIINNKKYSAREYVEYVNASENDDYLKHFIDGFLINGKYQFLTGYEIDKETIEIREYIRNKFPRRIGFRWGINIV